MNDQEHSSHSGTTLLKQYEHEIYLLLILLVGGYLRFHGLINQSYWTDEIETMYDARPGQSWTQFFFLVHNFEGLHPPLFMMLERFFLSVAGYSDWAGRALSALGGVASLWAVYLLGKEIGGKRIGLMAAALLSVNYFNIYYSQEARMYSFVCLFTALSYYFFIRVCRQMRRSDAVWLAVTTSALIYTHYFGFLVILSELALALFFLARAKESRGRLFRLLFVLYLIIGLTYLPWVRYLGVAAGVHSFWSEKIRPDILVKLFTGYFNYSILLSLFSALCCIAFFIAALFQWKRRRDFADRPVAMGFVFVFITLLVSIGIPYIRSVLVVPMIVPRYTMIVIPTVMLAIAFGLDLIPLKPVKYLLLGSFMAFSVYHLAVIKKYYTLPCKSQLREMCRMITTQGNRYPVINEVSSWYNTYYLDQFKYQGNVFDGKMAGQTKDSLLAARAVALHLDSVSVADTFWVADIGAISDHYVSEQQKKHPEINFSLIRDSIFYGAWARLYVARYKVIARPYSYAWFDPGQVQSDGRVAIWSGKAVSRPIPLAAGHYEMIIESSGTPALGVYPHIRLYVNGQRKSDFYSTVASESRLVDFGLPRDTTLTLTLEMDNDTSANGEDRNAFIHNLYILKTTQ